MAGRIDRGVDPIIDPATGEAFTEVAAGTPADAVSACDAAEAAQPGWAATPPRERSEMLRSCWTPGRPHHELAELIVRENGKPMADAKGEIAYAAEFFRWNAEETVRIHGRSAWRRRVPTGSSCTTRRSASS